MEKWRKKWILLLIYPSLFSLSWPHGLMAMGQSLACFALLLRKEKKTKKRKNDVPYLLQPSLLSSLLSHPHPRTHSFQRLLCTHAHKRAHKQIDSQTDGQSVSEVVNEGCLRDAPHVVAFSLFTLHSPPSSSSSRDEIFSLLSFPPSAHAHLSACPIPSRRPPLQ